MRRQKSSKFLSVLLICSLGCVPLPFVKMVQAAKTEQTKETKEEQATKTDISEKTLTVPIRDAEPAQLSIVNPEENAVYFFQSANQKIASVGKDTGVITGKKQGSVEITLYQKKRKKDKKIASCMVTVKQATVKKKNQAVKVAVHGTITPVIHWKNSEAEYRYISANKKIVNVEEKIDDTGATSIVITALKKGKTTLTIKEKYKKNKTVVGKIAITVKEPVLATQSISMIKGQTMKISNAVTVQHEDTSQDVEYAYESADETILSVDGNQMKAKKVTDSIALYVYRILDGKSIPLGTVAVSIAGETEKVPEANVGSNYIDLSDYENDYDEGFDDYDDNHYYPIGSDYVEDEMDDSDDSYTDYEEYMDESENTW